MRRCLVVLSLVVLPSCTGYRPVSFYEESLGRSTGPDFSFQLHNYFTNGNRRSDFYLAISNSALQFTKEGDGYVAGYEIAVRILGGGGSWKSVRDHDKATGIVAEKNWTETITESDYDATVARAFHVSQRSFLLEPGSYKVTAEVTDVFSKRTMQRTQTLQVPDYQNRFLSISDLSLGSRFITRDGEQTLIPDISPEMSTTGVDRYTYFEIYDRFPGREISFDYRLHITDRYETPLFLSPYHRGDVVKRLEDTLFWAQESTLTSISPSVPVLLPLPALQNGHYRLDLVVREAVDQPTGAQSEVNSQIAFSVWPTGFPEILTLEQQIEVLEHIASTDEIRLLREAKRREEKQQRLKEFWDQHLDRDEYYKRAEYANRYFTCIAEGWRTPFGWAYMVVGPPDNIQLSPQGIERWRYTLRSNRSLVLPFVIREVGVGDQKCKHGLVFIDPSIRRDLILRWKRSE